MLGRGRRRLDSRFIAVLIFCVLVLGPLVLSLIFGRLPADGCQFGFGSIGC